jgi:hypothetical protein
MASKDKPAAAAADDGDQAPAPDDGDQAPAAAADELPPYHGLEPSWVREALTDLLARVTKLEGKR